MCVVVLQYVPTIDTVVEVLSLRQVAFCGLFVDSGKELKQTVKAAKFASVIIISIYYSTILNCFFTLKLTDNVKI